LYRRHHRLAGVPALVLALSALYACGVVAFTLFPLPDAPCTSGGAGWRLEPFAALDEAFDAWRADGLVAGAVSGPVLQVVMNVALFVPLGFLLGWRTRRGLGAAALIGLALSLLIELTQGTGNWGLYECPYRLAEFDDLVANTSGAALGWIVGRATVGRLPYPEPATAPDAGPPGVGRRCMAGVVDLVVLAVVGLLLEVVVLGPIVALEGSSVVDRAWFGWLRFALGQVLAGGLLLWWIPRRRRDGATPGQWSTLLATAAARGGPATDRAVTVRFAVRWVPVLVAAGLSGGLVPVVLVVVLVSDLVSIRSTPDDRSVAGRASGTVTVTSATLVRPRQDRSGAG
ncbi:MAG: VanZ family protein, partial [Actinomycetota bacterium]